MQCATLLSLIAEALMKYAKRMLPREINGNNTQHDFLNEVVLCTDDIVEECETENVD